MIRAEEAEAVGERLFVDPVCADRRAETAGDLRDRLRLSGVQPSDQRGVNDGNRESQGASGSLRHRAAYS